MSLFSAFPRILHFCHHKWQKSLKNSMKSFTSKVVLWWIMWRIVFVFLLKYFIRRVLNFPPLLSYVLRFCDILFHVNLMLPRKANNGLQDFFFFQSRKSRFENYIRKAIKRFLNLWRSDAICSRITLHLFRGRSRRRF